MGLFDFVMRLLFGGPERLVRRYNAPGCCPFCGSRLRTDDARQCFTCGADWHDPENPVRRGRPRPVPRTQTEAPRRKSVRLDALDASQFAPVTRDEMVRQAKALGRPTWLNPWFGRRDLIPPATDGRTLLIDQGMVAQGLVTPDELAEIHRAGEAMDKVRPDLVHAGHLASRAVAQSKAEREALKRKKKQEAADRKRRHAEAVARRRATDVVFLGRGVSRGLADRRANVEKLQSRGLPVLATPADVAEALGLSIPRLRWLAFHSEASMRTHYVRFTVPKRSGGTRELASPHRDLRRCQRWILGSVLDKLTVHEAAHGFVRGRSTLTGAAVHAGSEVLVNTDLKDFFPSITFPRVMGLFRAVGYSPAVATIFALLSTESPRRTVDYAGTVYHVATGPRALPQGACTSPALSNLVARRLDARLAGLADKLGWTYTRYADDATFSASGEPAGRVGYLLARIRHITADEGFSVNEKKTRVLRRNTAQTVTGIVVNERPGVPRKLVRRLRAILHHAKTEGLAAQNREGHPHFESWVRGMVAYVSMVNPQQGRPLQQALTALPD